MKPIATYSDRHFEGSRTYTLFKNTIVIRGKKFLRSEFEVTVALETINPHADKIWVRNQPSSWILLPVVVFVVGASVGGSMLALDFQTSIAMKLILVALPSGLISCALAVFRFQKIEFVSFKNNYGVSAFEISRTGKSASQFDSFVNELQKQIRESKAAT